MGWRTDGHVRQRAAGSAEHRLDHRHLGVGRDRRALAHVALRRVVTRFWPYARPHRRVIAAALALAVLRPAFVEQRRLGDVLARITGDVAAIERLVVSGCSARCSTCCGSCSSPPRCFILRWELALAALAVVPLFWVTALLLAEGRLLARLSHPHLVRGYETARRPVPVSPWRP